jgi:hypothetical protein
MDYRTRHTPTLTPACVGVGRNTLLKSSAISIPVLVSATISNAIPNQILLTFNQNLDATSIPIDSDFIVLVNSIPVLIGGYAFITMSIYGVDLDEPPINGDIIVISYIKPIINMFKGLTGLEVAGFTGYPVVNNVLP